MAQKGGTIFGSALALLLMLGGCATPGQQAGPGGQEAGSAQEDGPPLTEDGQEQAGATAEGLGGAQAGEAQALDEQAQAEAEPAVTKPGEHRVFFDFDSAQLSDQARELIRKHADYLKANTDIQVTLEGHADERGSREYNLALGERRAKSVRRILLVHGVGSDRLEVVSFGEEQPLVDGHDEEAYARNRRVKLDYDGTDSEG
jgi:peptidoglycan-associated lipoprotein